MIKLTNSVLRAGGWRAPRLVAPAIVFLVSSSLAATASAQVDAPTADLTDDGNVNILDYSLLGSRFGLQAGEVGYLEGLDLVPDGVIDFGDIQAMFAFFYSTGVETGGTTLTGRVFDGLGNPLPGVTVEVGTNTVTGTTDENGFYSLPIPAGDLGDTVITFNGSGASDPSPGGSTEYPTIPNKPIFINGGTDTRFRDMSLPERDLTGAVDLGEGGVAVNVGGNAWMLNDDVTVQNSGVTLEVPAGCTAIFPDNEDPVLSITRVDPAMLPVPMPPGLSSTIFVTYQPGGTEVECPAGAELFTKFDNSDQYNQGNGPFLAGIIPGEGVFDFLVECDVVDTDNDGQPNDPDDTLNCGPIPVPFEFAWYHVDIPVDPCPTTTVAGTVRLNDIPMTPVAGASVSVPGVGPVTTNVLGNFSISNVPAGPNGTRCFSNPFSIRASATDGSDLGVSGSTPAVPGGITDVGDIKFGLSGTVQGSVLKLSSISPFIVVPLEGAQMDVDTVLTEPECCPTTDVNGNYNVINVPGGAYTVFADFFGPLPVPGGGTELKNLRGEQSGDISFDGKLEARDFRFTGTGSVRVTVTDTLGNPVDSFGFSVESSGGDLGSGFVAPDYSTLRGGSGGSGTARGVPQGDCKVTILEFFEIPVAMADCFVNEHGEEVEVIFEDLDLGGSGPGGPS